MSGALAAASSVVTGVTSAASGAASGGGGILSDVGGFLGSAGGQTLGAIAGAGAEAFGASQAAAAEEKSSDKATQAIMDMYNQTRRDLTPWRTTGSGALAQYGALSGIGAFGRPTTPEETKQAQEGYVETPGYQFRFDEGVRALDRSASSKGRLMSGAHERELTRYGQGIGADEFGTYANRLANLAGLGQDAGTATGAFGSAAAGDVSQSTQAAGTARASGYTGVANAFNTGLQSILASYAKG
jgi:hypothetical protein